MIIMVHVDTKSMKWNRQYNTWSSSARRLHQGNSAVGMQPHLNSKTIKIDGTYDISHARWEKEASTKTQIRELIIPCKLASIYLTSDIHFENPSHQ